MDIELLLSHWVATTQDTTKWHMFVCDRDEGSIMASLFQIEHYEFASKDELIQFVTPNNYKIDLDFIPPYQVYSVPAFENTEVEETEDTGVSVDFVDAHVFGPEGGFRPSKFEVL